MGEEIAGEKVARGWVGGDEVGGDGVGSGWVGGGGYEGAIQAMLAWLRDPERAERCATFPVDSERVSHAGVYAWHGDDVANALIGDALGCAVVPLYVDQAGGHSRRAGRASGATLSSRIARHHLRGSTRASNLRRSLAALLWNELELRCEHPPALEVAGNQRLSKWMLEHLSVATVPFDDRSRLCDVGVDIVERLNPPLNLAHLPSTPGRKRLRVLRRRHLSLATADVERIERLLKLHAAASAGGEGSDFLARRLAHEQRRLAARSG